MVTLMNKLIRQQIKKSDNEESPDSRGLRMNNFEGKTHEDVEDFLQQWEYFANAKNIRPEWRASQMRNYLGRDVNSRLRALSNDERDDEDAVIDWLRDTYGVESERYYAQKEFANMLQDHKETARNYMDRLKAKWRIAYDGEEGNWRTHRRAKETIRDQFFKGLRNQDVSDVMEDRTRTLSQEEDEDFLKKLAEKTDSEILHKLSRKNTKQTTKIQDALLAAEGKKKEPLKALEVESGGEESEELYEDQVDSAVDTLLSSGKVLCKAMGQREFKTREAGPDDTCYGCGQNGHFSRNCPTHPYTPGAQGNFYQTRNTKGYVGYGNRGAERTFKKEPTADALAEAIDKAIEKRLPFMQELKEMVMANQAMMQRFTSDEKKPGHGANVKQVENDS